MSHHKVELRDVSFSYPGADPAINGVSFLLHHGESVGIIGANGAGKSTLLLLLVGLLFPDQGQVAVGDVQLTKKTLPLIRRSLGMVFQDPDDQLFMPTVYEDVAFGPRNYQLQPHEVEERVLDALEQVGISHLRDRPPFKLSGGEKRRAAIASVLAMEPDVLIMDEPTSFLDPRGRRKVIKLMQSFSHTKIITSHDLDMILETCQRVILLDAGRVVADGPVADVLYDRPLLESCGLELPLTRQGMDEELSPLRHPAGPGD